MTGPRTITIHGDSTDDEDALWMSMCGSNESGTWQIREQVSGLCICTPPSDVGAFGEQEQQIATADDSESPENDPTTMEIPVITTLKGQLRGIMRERADGKLSHPRPSSAWNASGGRRRNERASRQGDRQ